MEEKMKNSKKLLFAGTLALALSASAVLPTNVHADGEEVPSTEENVNDTVKLNFKPRIKKKWTCE